MTHLQEGAPDPPPPRPVTGTYALAPAGFLQQRSGFELRLPPAADVVLATSPPWQPGSGGGGGNLSNSPNRQPRVTVKVRCIDGRRGRRQGAGGRHRTRGLHGRLPGGPALSPPQGMAAPALRGACTPPTPGPQRAAAKQPRRPPHCRPRSTLPRPRRWPCPSLAALQVDATHGSVHGEVEVPLGAKMGQYTLQLHAPDPASTKGGPATPQGRSGRS